MTSCMYAGTESSPFRAADEELLNLLVQGCSDQEFFSGTVVCVALLRTKDLWIATISCRLLSGGVQRENTAETVG